jgi:hypothetical protein
MRRNDLGVMASSVCCLSPEMTRIQAGNSELSGENVSKP